MAFSIRELVATFGIQVDETGANKAESQINGIITGVKAIGRAVVAAAVTQRLISVVRHTNAEAIAMARLSERLGVSTDLLEQFSFVSAQAGVRAEVFNKSLQKFIFAAGQAKTGSKEMAQNFSDVGLSLTGTNGQLRSSDELFREFIDRLAAVQNPAERLRIAMKLFGEEGASMVNIVANGSAGLKALQDDFATLDAGLLGRLVPTVERVDRQMIRLKTVTANFSQQIALTLNPYVEKATEKMTAWFGRNRDFIMQRIDTFFGSMAKAVEFVGATIGKVLGALSAFWASLSIGEKIILAVAVALGIVRIAMANPLTAALTAIVLLIEDFVVWMNGGQSAIGSLVEAISEFVGKSPFLLSIIQAINTGFNGTVLIIETLINMIWGVINVFTELSFTKAFDMFKGRMGDAVKDFMAAEKDVENALSASVQREIAPPSAVTAAASRANVQTISPNVNQTININAGNVSPEAVANIAAQKTKEVWEEQMRSARRLQPAAR